MCEDTRWLLDKITDWLMIGMFIIGLFILFCIAPWTIIFPFLASIPLSNRD